MEIASARRVTNARRQVQELLGADHDSEIVFTSCGTESDATAIMSALKSFPERREIVTTTVEHPAVLSLCEHLGKCSPHAPREDVITRSVMTTLNDGYVVHRLPVDGKGRLDLKEYRKLLSSKTAIVSIMWANNETGTIFPVEEMAALAHAHGALFHTDAVQAVGKVPIDLKKTNIDMLSLSGHKLHAPKGVGVLYLRRGTRFRPLLRGGHQERGRRAGTENTASIVGLGKAAELALEHLEFENTSVRAMRDRLERGILAAVPNAFVTGDPGNRLPNTTNIAFEYVEGESILLKLNKEGVAASSGSACTSGSLEPSHVMRAMGIPYTAAHGTVRFSLSRCNTMAEIERVVAVVPPIVAQLQALSPYWEKDGPAVAANSFTPTFA